VVVALMALINLPILLLGVILSCTWASIQRDRRRKRVALERGRCELAVAAVPGHECGMPIAACLDLYEGDRYRFFRWLCDGHARDAERRARGGLYRIEWLSAGDPGEPTSNPSVAA
jgi:hypothetical protein